MKCECCDETDETSNIHIIGGTFLCERHVDTPFSRDVNPDVNPGDRFPDPDVIDDEKQFYDDPRDPMFNTYED